MGRLRLRNKKDGTGDAEILRRTGAVPGQAKKAQPGLVCLFVIKFYKSFTQGPLSSFIFVVSLNHRS